MLGPYKYLCAGASSEGSDSCSNFNQQSLIPQWPECVHSASCLQALTQGGGPSVVPHSLIILTKASQQYVQRHKGILGNASGSLWLEHKVMVLFLVSFLFILQRCDLIKWN